MKNVRCRLGWHTWAQRQVEDSQYLRVRPLRRRPRRDRAGARLTRVAVVTRPPRSERHRPAGRLLDVP